ncbi:MAG: AmmeMemoRadiSam system protein A [Microgenomates group bacterium]
MKNIISSKGQKEALTIARKTLEKYLSDRQIPSFSPKAEVLKKPLGAFVTLKKNKQLRGCIGTFEPKDPLYTVIQKMAIAAATQDPRFFPVSKEELNDIKIEISVLTPKTKINNWRKIKLGKHGVVIQKGFRSGTFLPQVATETGWNLEEFLSQLCTQKAGLPPDCYKDPTVNLYTFKAQIFEER